MKLIVDKNLHLQDFLLNWLACVPSGCIGIGLSMRRAVTTAISSYDGLIANALKKLLTQFGDKLHIQHAPIIMQEVCTQNLLILVGRLFRQESTLLKTIARSSIFINAVSNRLAASSERPRFLGMVTGMAISELIDDSDKRMKFTTDTLNSPDTEWYLQLTGIQDNFGNSDDLKILEGGSPLIQADSDHLAVKKKPSRITESPPKSVASKITSIEEVYSDEDEDFPTYRKPDSDAEDSDDDPTLINRNKPKPPVYIRDLLIYLKDTENHDRHVLAMSHASSLIRRKSTYGAEVTDHIEDLASLICGLKDEHDIATWQSQRLAAMVAIILAQPKPMGKWFANMVFSGDYSISQRASMLTAITLSARELAGYASEDAELTKAPLSQEQLFPSKQLTPKYAKLYLQSINPISSATQTLEHRILHPLTAQALSNTTKPLPSILQTRTFSTRLAVESRKKPINNILSTIVSESLFHPLTNAWQIHTLTHHHTGNSTFNTPLLQSHLLKTLTLILSAAGPNTLSLQTLTSTYWSLLLSPTIRLAATQARNVMEAVLFGLLTLLELNGAGPDGGGGAGGGGRWLAEECGGMIVETRAWIAGVLERCSGGSGSGVRSVGNGGKGGGEDKVGMLAAGVLVRVGEVVEKYERLLMGELASV